MTGWQRVRAALNWLNLTTLAGLAMALAGRASIRRGPGGLLIAGGHALSMVRQTCLTMGNLVLCRRPVDWLLSPDRAALLGHESRHATQYAILGPLFWPLYGLAALWSWLLTGGYAARNPFERWAGLKAGNYPDIPLRGWAARLARAFSR